MWLERVQRYIATPPDAWTIKEWQHAAEALGNIADAYAGLLHETLESQDSRPQEAWVPDLALLPNKRGRKPKLGSLSEAVRGKPKRGRGRPRRPETEKREILHLFGLFKASQERQLGRRLNNKETARLIFHPIYKDQGKRATRAEQVASAFAKDISRWRPEDRRPLRATRAKMKSQNSR